MSIETGKQRELTKRELAQLVVDYISLPPEHTMDLDQVGAWMDLAEKLKSAAEHILEVPF